MQAPAVALVKFTVFWSVTAKLSQPIAGPGSVMVSPPLPIAVLPFDDLSLEGDQRDFVRAIHPVQMTTMVGGEVWRGL